MTANREQSEWLIGSPIGIRTRICFDAPSGAHPLTPEHIRQRYAAEIRNSALVVWRLSERGIGGVRVGVDEVTWCDSDIAYFETSFCRPAKGHGAIWLTAQRHDDTTLNILLSDRYDDAIYAWHLAVVTLLDRAYPGLIRVHDNGFDV